MTTPLPLPLLPSSPMSFSDAIEKAKVADAATSLAEKVRDEGGQQAQVTALQPSKTQLTVPQAPSAITKRAGMPMRRLGDARRRVRTKMKTKRSSCLCLGCSTLRTKTPVLWVPRVRVSSIHSMRSACLGTCGSARR